jgi:hypothetical protein
MRTLVYVVGASVDGFIAAPSTPTALTLTATRVLERRTVALTHTVCR